MILVRVVRFFSDEENSHGVLAVVRPREDFVTCFSLEDEHRTVKVWGETRIAARRYRLGVNRLVAKPGDPKTFHQRYLRRFGPVFHRGMIEILGVPNFTGVLIHIGNDDDDTGGCILTGESTSQGWVARSTDAYKRIYPVIIEGILADPDNAWIDIVDVDDPPLP